MHKKQEHIIRCAHQLIIDKGYYQVSVQDIIDASGISKGTFYNYFHSKNDLVLSLLHHIKSQITLQRQLILQEGSLNDKNILKKQIGVKKTLNLKNRVFSLYEALIMENNKELKKFIFDDLVSEVRWLSHRLIHVFGEELQPYAFDLAAAFIGSLHHQLRVATMINNEMNSLEKFIDYNIDFLESAIPIVLKNKTVLFKEAAIEIVNPCYVDNPTKMKEKIQSILKKLKCDMAEENEEICEMLHFLETEMNEEKPRLHVVSHITRMLSSNINLPPEVSTQLMQLLQFVQVYQKQL
ncbi:MULTISPECIES: TetR/AcrR family transcriptional regulator [Bacillus]|uniref:TetR/AcrR family transcriptional regulator n=1 Tax=Bacillus TaxID=1386 RepID=UPI00031E1C9E|nr:MULTISPECIES: TetR/AcrR family transcriptional regulator [Bacillus]